jgi:hypothetical protein
MKGGLIFGAIGKAMDFAKGISAEDCKQTGYAFAEYLLKKYNQNIVPDKTKGDKIKQEYLKYYESLGNDTSEKMISVYTPIKIEKGKIMGAFSAAQSMAAKVIAGGIPGAMPGAGNKSMLVPKVFNEYMDYITSGWIDNMRIKRVLNSTNQTFVDFGLSYEKMMKSTQTPQTPQTNTGSNPAAAASAPANKGNGMLGSFTSKIPGLSFLGNKQ